MISFEIVTSSAVIKYRRSKVGFLRERHRDHDSLALSARKLMRIRREHALRIADVNGCQRGGRGFAAQDFFELK